MSGPGPDRASPRLRALRRLVGTAAPTLLALDLLAFAGFVARDRNAWLALMMYLPLLPLGLASVGLDLARRGRSLKSGRFGLAAVGLTAVVCSASEMVGWGATPAPPVATGEEIRVLHWNVLWGGRPRTEATWASIEDDVLRRVPDVAVLSEAPTDDRLDSLERRLGPGWTSTRLGHDPRSRYWSKLAVMSRWPVREGRPVPIRNGTALDVRVDRPGGTLRLLIVDGQSRPTQLRTPLLRDVSDACRLAAEESEPYDMLAGDFNAVGRSLGFDEVRACGYETASRSSTGWRGTWPMPLPIYDIDHVWVRGGRRILGCSLFANLACDHRGQLVRLVTPDRW